MVTSHARGIGDSTKPRVRAIDFAGENHHTPGNPDRSRTMRAAMSLIAVISAEFAATLTRGLTVADAQAGRGKTGKA